MKYEYDGKGGFRPESQENTSAASSSDKNAQQNRDIGSWVLIGVMFLVGLWPVGLILLISKLSADKSKKPAGVRSGSAAQTGVYSEKPAGVSAAASKPAGSKVTKSPKDTSKTARVLKIVGTVLTAVGGVLLLRVLKDLGFYLGEYGMVRWILEDLFQPVGILSGGIALLCGGAAMTRRMRRFSKYLAAAGKRQAVDISRLASAAEVSDHRVEKDLERMIDKGLWGKDAYLDLGERKLFLSADAAAEYYKEKNQPPVPEETEEGYSGILRNIRRANDRIADPELSAKIQRIEDVAGRILRLVESQPEKKNQAATFLTYYLPTTEKLLDSYAEFEETGVSGENLTQAKERIRRTMDNIVAGFEHQLDELYHADAMDIDSDIRVMETMLKRDQSSVEEDFGLGGGTVQQSGEEE